MRAKSVSSIFMIVLYIFSLGTESAFDCLRRPSPFLRPDYSDCHDLMEHLYARADVHDTYIFERDHTATHPSSYIVPLTYPHRSCRITVKLQPKMIAEVATIKNIADTSFQLLDMCLADGRSNLVGGRGDYGRLVVFVHGSDVGLGLVENGSFVGSEEGAEELLPDGGEGLLEDPS